MRTRELGFLEKTVYGDNAPGSCVSGLTVTVAASGQAADVR